MEKRIKKRIFKRLEVFFSHNGVRVRGITSNFSENGMFIRTKKGLQPGSRLECELKLPSGETLVLHGIVARTIKTRFQDIKNGMGIHFPDADPKYIVFVKTLE